MLALPVPGPVIGMVLLFQADERAGAFSGLERSFRVNAFGPMLVAKHFLPLMRHRDTAILANFSARIGWRPDAAAGPGRAPRGQLRVFA